MNHPHHNFLLKAYALKALPRAGWIRAGIEQPESVAAHSWGLSLLISLLAPTNLNHLRMHHMALAHDLPEVITGDITPHDGIPKAEKKEREAKAARSFLPPHILKAWQEYEENKTPEAQFVHMLDKLDMALQAQVYAHQANTQEFIESATPHIPQELQSLLNQLKPQNQ